MTVCERLALSVPAEVAPGTTTRHLIFPEGVFYHPSYGTLDLRKDFFTQMVRHFQERVRRIDIPVDLRHENGEAAGWVQQLEYVPGEGLYAHISWTDLGIEKVTSRRYRYFSPEFGTFEDPRTREKYPNTLFAVTLTNFPFLKELPAVEIRLEELTELTDPADIAYLAEKYPDVPEEDFAGPDRSFPIRNQNDVEDAWRLRGHAADPQAVARNIVRIAKRKGLKLPDNWQQVVEAEDPGSAPDAKEDAPRRKPTAARPRGNEGAIQPGTPRGARPHITRGRYPDPTSEVNQMAEHEQEQEQEGRGEATEVRTLSERLTRLEEENRRLAEALVEARRLQLERDVADEVRQLSERRVVAQDDGGATADVAYGLPATVTAMYREFALAHPDRRAAVYAMLHELQKTGLVRLTAAGTEAVDRAHDPVSSPLTPDNERRVVGEDIVRRAQEYARQHNLDWAKLADREAAFRLVLSNTKQA